VSFRWDFDVNAIGVGTVDGSSENTSTLTYAAPSTSMSLFNRAANNRGLIGSMYSMRLYNRKLTDAEIAYNREIDIKRFGA
jgi:hypothetical protein